ncbi:MAG: hypothetical protein AAGJ08_00050 [Cyanobacteria bacterium P01_H01_bin.35]
MLPGYISPCSIYFHNYDLTGISTDSSWCFDPTFWCYQELRLTVLWEEVKNGTICDEEGELIPF